MPQFDEFFDSHDAQIASLASQFSSYVFHIDRNSIRNWLKQFGENHIELGLKLLSNVQYYSPARILDESRELHRQLLVYKAMTNEELLNIPTYFVDYSPSSGRSQDEFIPKYRLGSGLRFDRYDGNFIYLRDINKFVNKKGVCLVFLTDFIGSGKQVTDTWLDSLWAISDKNEHILLAICGYDSGIRRIEEATEDRLTIITNRRYSNEHRIFSDENTNFTNEEKEALRQFCNLADDHPTGFQGTQSTTVFYFRCPNSVISILRATNDNWKGLFKRHL